MKVRLKDITNYSKGVQINGDDLVEEGEYIYLNGGINPSGRWNSSNVSGNTVTISEGGNSSGYVNYISEPFWCGAHCYYLYDGPHNAKYLYYALKSQQERLFAIRSGACMPNIKKSDLGNFEFEFDSNPEKQDEVVATLSKVESVITSRINEIELLDQLIKARFVELFSEDLKHAEITIGDIAEETTVGIANSATHAYSDSGIVMLRNQNIRINYLDDSELIYITPEFAAKYKNKSLKENDILITRTGVNIGMACIVPSKYEGCQTFTTLILRLKKNIGITSEFVCYYINSPLGKGFIDDRKVGGAQPNFGAKQLATMPIVIPDIDKQKSFASFVKQVDKSKIVDFYNTDNITV